MSASRGGGGFFARALTTTFAPSRHLLSARVPGSFGLVGARGRRSASLMSHRLTARGVNVAMVVAVITTRLLGAEAAEEFTADERPHFILGVESLTDKRLEGDKLEQLLARFEADQQKKGQTECLLALKARLGDDATCRLALSMAIRMLAADGI